MIPHRAYVLLPTQMASVSRGIDTTSTVSHRAKELGGISTWSLPVSSVSMVTNDFSENFLGSITSEFTLVKILKTEPTRRS